MTEQNSNTVAWVADAYLCCSCGACKAVCPEIAIGYVETVGGYLFPEIEEDRCTDCGKCLQSCAGIVLEADLPEDPFAGPVLGCWVGKATDEKIYTGSQSGGAVTAILLDQISAGKIGGAVTVVMEPGSPPRPKIVIARNRSELLAAQGSKYSPVPVLSLMGELEKEEEPVAVVALGCHVHGWTNVLKMHPELQPKAGLVIGLICERVMLASAIDYLVQRSGMRMEKTTNLRFKSKEWRGYPGDVRISSEGKPAVFLPSRERMAVKDFFTPVRCRLCFDKMNVLSDITAGDPWGIPGIDMKLGESLVIARTQAGMEAVRLAERSGALTLREIPYEAILSGQAIDEKKDDFIGHCNTWKLLGRSLPDQANTALSRLSHTAPKGDFERNLQQGLSMDQYPSRNALVDGAQKWVRNKRLSKKVHKILGPLARMIHQETEDHSTSGRKGRMMNIEIFGAKFKNKGAHLMLVAVVEKLSATYPNARLAIRWKLKKSMKTGGLKLYKKPSESESFIGDLILRILYSKRARKRKQLILDSEINLVLDISGFQYSDKFGHGNIANRAKRMRKLKRAGKKVFLLPQGFGPFEAPRVQRAIHTVVDHAELIFARDQDSYDHMERLVGKRSNIVMSPDFTNLLKGTLPDKFTAKEARVCLIPNTQMIAKTSAEIGESYLPFLARCAIFLENADLNPFILLHETGKDTALAREIQKLSGLDLEIVDEKDPVNLKGIIGSCHFVIGSRYHALVSALSQGVPAVATSWSHKYERLYEDYDCKELLISNLDFETGALDVLEDLTDQENYRKIVLRLKESGDRELQRTEQMWEQVIKAIGQKNGNDR